MGRGKLLSTKIKMAIERAQPYAEAVELAKQKIHMKLEKNKPWEVSAKEHIGKMIDRIDPLEMAAILSLTYITHETVDWTSSRFDDLKKQWKAIPVPKPILEWGLTALGQSSSTGLGDILTGDPMLWLVSFLTAFFIMRHGGEISGVLNKVMNILTVV